jgi:hypothetical protein
MAGVLSRVFLRSNIGSATIEARSGFDSRFQATRTASLTRSCRPSFVSKRTFMPTLTNTCAEPVSWQIGRLPMAAMRELIRICAIAALAEALCSVR